MWGCWVGFLAMAENGTDPQKIFKRVLRFCTVLFNFIHKNAFSVPIITIGGLSYS